MCELGQSVMRQKGKSGGNGGRQSFKKIRKSRKIGRMAQHKDKLLTRKENGSLSRKDTESSLGPTKETQAKLTQDPLVRFRQRNILSDEQIWAFQRIRRAVQVITDGTQVRVSQFNDVVVQTSRHFIREESTAEIRIKEDYTRWIDRLTELNIQAGPILDVIIDEFSLAAVDRKWGKRKGWAKDQLQSALDLYGGSFSPSNRDK